MPKPFENAHLRIPISFCASFPGCCSCHRRTNQPYEDGHLDIHFSNGVYAPFPAWFWRRTAWWLRQHLFEGPMTTKIDWSVLVETEPVEMPWSWRPRFIRWTAYLGLVLVGYFAVRWALEYVPNETWGIPALEGKGHHGGL